MNIDFDAKEVVYRNKRQRFGLVDGSGYKYAVAILCSDADVRTKETHSAGEDAVIITPYQQNQRISNSRYEGENDHDHLGGGCVISTGKGYVDNSHIFAKVSDCGEGLDYGKHGCSIYGGGQKIYGNKRNGWWDYWRPVIGTEFMMEINLPHENMLYEHAAISNNSKGLVPKRRNLKRGIAGKLNLWEWDITYRLPDVVYIHVNYGLSEEEMASGDITTKLSNHSVTNCTIGGEVYRMVDNHPTPREGHGFVLDDGLLNCGIVDGYAEDCDGFGGAVNAGINCFIDGFKSKGNKRGDALFLPNTVGLTVDNFIGDAPEIIWDKSNKEDINVNVINYRKLI